MGFKELERMDSVTRRLGISLSYRPPPTGQIRATDTTFSSDWPAKKPLAADEEAVVSAEYAVHAEL
jgi:hypothetical protein